MRVKSSSTGSSSRVCGTSVDTLPASGKPNNHNHHSQLTISQETSNQDTEDQGSQNTLLLSGLLSCSKSID